MKQFKITVISITIILCCLAGYALAYHYLNFSEAPEKSDAVVLFVGPDQDQRLKEAHQLMYEGYADTLIIPAYQQVFVMSEGQIIKASGVRLKRFPLSAYPDYYENTHVEALLAKQIMEQLGFKSALLVSAPWHMRRISIIASQIFYQENFQIKYVGSRFLRQKVPLSIFGLANLKVGITEAVKIVSFIAYKIAA